MVIIAGMLPGVESTRRRRLRPSPAEEPCGARRRSLCLSAHSKETRNEETAAHAWTSLDSNAREAKERLDQKLRRQRESMAAKRHQSTGCAGDDGRSSISAGAGAGALRREVVPKKAAAGAGRFGWRRLFRAAAASSPGWEDEECAVCLEEFRAGEVVARLPCAHRFHWACAVPWVRAASRCPVCRAHAQAHPASRPWL